MNITAFIVRVLLVTCTDQEWESQIGAFERVLVIRTIGLASELVVPLEAFGG